MLEARRSNPTLKQFKNEERGKGRREIEREREKGQGRSKGIGSGKHSAIKEVRRKSSLP